MDLSRRTKEVNIILGRRGIRLRGLPIVNSRLSMFDCAVGLLGRLLKFAEATLLVYHALGFRKGQAVVNRLVLHFARADRIRYLGEELIMLLSVRGRML